jgi:hypothetical protein
MKISLRENAHCNKNKNEYFLNSYNTENNVRILVTLYDLNISLLNSFYDTVKQNLKTVVPTLNINIPIHSPPTHFGVR